MQDWFDVAKKIEACALDAARKIGLDEALFSADVRPADPRFGDMQINGALPYAKRQKVNPREIAQKLVAALEEDEAIASRATLEIAGPGFINLRFDPKFYLDWLNAFSTQSEFQASAAKLYTRC